jgi:hypothetical protein
MDGTVAFAIALVSYGNAHLENPVETNLLRIPSDRPTLKYILETDFRSNGHVFARRKGKKVAATIEEWFDFIHRKGAKRLWLVFGEELDSDQKEIMQQLESKLLGIQVDYPTDHEMWVPDWDTVVRAQRPRIWQVSVKGMGIPTSMASKPGDLNAVREDIRKGLEDAIVFAKKSATGEFFSSHFAEGLTALESASPAPPYYPDMLPSRGYSILARQVIAGASYGWVFGGMGSWNDIWFSDDSLMPEYNRITETLRRSVKMGLREGVNSFSL